MKGGVAATAGTGALRKLMDSIAAAESYYFMMESASRGVLKCPVNVSGSEVLVFLHESAHFVNHMQPRCPLVKQ